MHDEHLEIEDIATVAKLSAGIATLKVQRGGGCKSCAMHNFCFSKDSEASFEVASSLPLTVGDRVQIKIAPIDKVVSSLMIFVMPVLALFMGYFIAAQFLVEVYAALCGFLLLALSFIVLRVVDKKLGVKMKAEIVRVLESPNQGGANEDQPQ